MYTCRVHVVQPHCPCAQLCQRCDEADYRDWSIIEVSMHAAISPEVRLSLELWLALL